MCRLAGRGALRSAESHDRNLVNNGDFLSSVLIHYIPSPQKKINAELHRSPRKRTEQKIILYSEKIFISQPIVILRRKLPPHIRTDVDNFFRFV